MTDSPRKLIRQAVTALLAAPSADDPPQYPSPAGPRVYPNRVLNLSEAALPALLVYTLKETNAGEVEIDVPLRSLTLLVEVRAAGDEVLDDLLDDTAWAVEQLLVDHPDLGLAVPGLDIQEVTWQEFSLVADESGALIDGRAVTEIEVRYSRRKPEAEFDLSPFERVHSRQLGPGPEEGGAVVEVRAELPQED